MLINRYLIVLALLFSSSAMARMTEFTIEDDKNPEGTTWEIHCDTLGAPLTTSTKVFSSEMPEGQHTCRAFAVVNTLKSAPSPEKVFFIPHIPGFNVRVIIDLVGG